MTKPGDAVSQSAPIAGQRDIILSPRRDPGMIPQHNQILVDTSIAPTLDPYAPLDENGESTDLVGFVRYRVTQTEFDRLMALYGDASGQTKDYRFIPDPPERFQIGENEWGDPILVGMIA